jgi:uncharacterized membrane protein
MKPPIPFVRRGKHHGYIGIFFIIFGAVFHWLDMFDPESILWFWDLCIGIGIFMVVDDIVEHKVTGSTPLRLLFEKVIRPWLR